MHTGGGPSTSDADELDVCRRRPCMDRSRIESAGPMLDDSESDVDRDEKLLDRPMSGDGAVMRK